MFDDLDLPQARASSGECSHTQDDERRGLLSSAGRSLGGRTRDLMRQYDLRARKSLGQNFLINDAKVERIAAAAAEAASALDVSLLVEIGPGLGALTTALAAHPFDVVAFEIDERLREPLLSLLEGTRAEVRFQDFLLADLSVFPPYVAAGNLPYQITAPLLEKLFWDERCRALVITVQREVADRLRAAPGTRDYGPLTLFCRYHVERVEVIVQLKPGDFLPPPTIDSTAIRLVKRATPPFEKPSAQSFSRAVKAAFIHRRKALRAGLKQAPQLSLTSEQVQRALDLAGLEGERRAETLDMDEFARLALALEEVEKS